MKPRIFISHAHDDKSLPTIKFLVNELSKSYYVWYDRDQLEFGESITRGVEEGMRNCNLVLVLWSKNARNSRGVREEVALANRLHKKLIPVKIADADPHEHPLFRDVLAVDMALIYGDNPHNSVGFRRLSIMLKKMWLEAPEFDGQHELKRQVDNLNRLGKELEELADRKRRGEYGNEHSTIYLVAVLEALMRALGGDVGSDEDQKQVSTAFFVRVKTFCQQYPGADHQVKLARAIVAEADRMDPHRQNSFIQGAKMHFGRIIGVTVDPSTAAVPLPFDSHQVSSNGKAAPPPKYATQQYTGNRITDPIKQQIERVRSMPGAHEELRKRIIQQMPAFHPKQWPAVLQLEQFLNHYIDESPKLLDAFIQASVHAGVTSYAEPLIMGVVRYFATDEDYIPSHFGVFGLLDDAYVAHYAFHLFNQNYRTITGHDLLNIDVSEPAQGLSAVMGPELTQQLNQMVQSHVNQIIAAHQYQQLANQWGQTMNVGNYGGWSNINDNDVLNTLVGGVGF